MKIPNLSAMKGVFTIGKAFVLAHRPEMLFGASVVASIGSTALAAKGGYEARDKIADAEMERIMYVLSKEAVQEVEIQVNNPANRLTLQEKAALTWKCYVPAGLALTTAVGSTTGLHLVHVKDKKALVAAGMSALTELRAEAEEWMDEIEDATSEHLTDDEKKSVSERLREKRHEKLTKASGGKDHVNVCNTDGEIEELYLVRDNFSGRDIWSNEQRIADALNSLNRWLVQEGDCELNHFYGVAGFGNIPIGDDMGWSGEPVSISWDTVIRDDGRPVRRFTFRQTPRDGYAGKG